MERVLRKGLRPLGHEPLDPGRGQVDPFTRWLGSVFHAVQVIPFTLVRESSWEVGDVVPVLGAPIYLTPSTPSTCLG